MSISSFDTIKSAHSILESKRQYALVESDRRLDEVSAVIPSVMGLTLQLSDTCVELSNVVFSKSDDTKSAIEKIMHRNLNVQRQLEALLVSHGFPADYLDVKYSCKKCDDTGYVLGKRCECLQSLINRLLVENFNSENYFMQNQTFDNFSLLYYATKQDKSVAADEPNPNIIMKAIYENCKDYAEHFKPNAKSILMVGGTGLGKTHLSIAIASHIMKNGFSVMYTSAPDIFRKLQNEYYGKGEPGLDTMDLIQKTDLFILDDLGAEVANPFSISILYNIVNSRLNSSKPTIISTNLSLKEIEQRYSDRVASRLITMYRCLKFVGKDIRQIKMKEQRS